MQVLTSAYNELPPSLRAKFLPVRSSKPGNALPAQDLKGLVPIPAHPSLPAKLSNRTLPLQNPAKKSDRYKAEKEIARSEKQKQKIAAKRRRSGRLTAEDALALRGGSSKSKKPLAQGKVAFELMVPLHHLWLGYIAELLNISLRHATAPSHVANSNVDTSTVQTLEQNRSAKTTIKEIKSVLDDDISHSQMQSWQAKLVKADFHGAKLEVKQAKHPSLIGLSGIVVQETEGTFRIVTPKNIIKVVPKDNVVFSFQLPLVREGQQTQKDLEFELFGSNFVFRSADRASRKFKSKGVRGFDL